MNYELVRGRKFRGEQERQKSVYVSELIGLILTLGNLMFIKQAYLSSKLRLSGKYLF